MACKDCNDCQDLGCAPLVYPKCILTEVAYPCIGVAAGVTGTVLFAAINTKFCGIAASLSTINSTILTIQSDIVNIAVNIVTIEGDITEINECLLDATGGCEIDNLQASITNIEGDITVIENDITNLGSDISTLQSCVLDASGNCFADETWKIIGTVGNMDNGEPIPDYTAQTSATLAGRLRHKVANHTEVQFIGTVSVADTLQLRSLFILPDVGTGIVYRPTGTIEYPACGILNDGSGPWIGSVSVNSAGSVYVTVHDPIFITDTIINLGFCILIPTD